MNNEIEGYEYPCNAGYLRKALRENGMCCAALSADDMARIILDEWGSNDAEALMRALARLLEI
jgi:hypothetical protein